MNTISLRTKFSVLNFAVLLGVLALAYTGYDAINKLLQLTKLEVVTNAIRHHMELDMMHDAINGDTLTAVSSLQNKNKEGIEKSKEDLKEHLATVEENFKAIKELELAPDVVEAYKHVVPGFEAYGKSAVALMEIATNDLENNSNNYLAAAKEFEAKFEELEALMSETSDKVQAWSAHIKEDGINTANSERQKLVAVLIFSILLALVSPIYAKFSMFRSLKKIEDVASELSQENYDVVVPFTERGDEIGRLARALNVLREKAAEVFRLKNMVEDMPINIMTADIKNNYAINYMNKTSITTLTKLQQYLPVKVEEMLGKSIDIFHKNPTHQRSMLADPSKLPHRAKIKLGGETLDLSVSAMMDKNNNYIGPMLTWAIVTHNERLAEDFESSIGLVSNSVTSAAKSIQQSALLLSSSVEELSATALEISRQTSQSIKVVDTAMAESNSANMQMTQLMDAATKVSGVTDLIQAIAAKTNLLALNATIESARAGDAGKGFSVVAGEVKDLANQTANAITNISAQIGAMITSSKNATQSIKSIAEVVGHINEIAATIASAVEQQQAATQEIARSISGNSEYQHGTDVMAMSNKLVETSTSMQAQCDEFLKKVRQM